MCAAGNYHYLRRIARDIIACQSSSYYWSFLSARVRARTLQLYRYTGGLLARCNFFSMDVWCVLRRYTSLLAILYKHKYIRTPSLRQRQSCFLWVGRGLGLLPIRRESKSCVKVCIPRLQGRLYNQARWRNKSTFCRTSIRGEVLSVGLGPPGFPINQRKCHS